MDPREIRTEVTEEGMNSLASSIKRIGIRQPIEVERKKKKYVIIYGHRRYLAAKHLGLSTIPAIITKPTRKQRSIIVLHENLQREEVNHFDIARWIAKTMEEEKMSQQEIADMFGFTQPWVSMHLRLLRIPGELQAAVEGNQIDYHGALQLARIKDDARRRVLLSIAIKDGTNAGAIRRWVQAELGIQQPAPPQGGALDKAEKEEPPPELKFRCFVCSNEYLNDSCILIRTCSKCFRILQAIVEKEKELSDGEDQPH